MPRTVGYRAELAPGRSCVASVFRKNDRTLRDVFVGFDPNRYGLPVSNTRDGRVFENGRERADNSRSSELHLVHQLERPPADRFHPRKFEPRDASAR